MFFKPTCIILVHLKGFKTRKGSMLTHNFTLFNRPTGCTNKLRHPDLLLWFKLHSQCDNMANVKIRLFPHHLVSQLRGAKSRRRHFALGPRQVDGQLLHPAGVSGDDRAGENGLGRHGRQVRQ